MGGVSADGIVCSSGRYDAEVYAISTTTGRLLAGSTSGRAHGLCVWPQPGRYSLGHTGILRRGSRSETDDAIRSVRSAGARWSSPQPGWASPRRVAA
jgi:hypothetical protein